MIRPSLLALLAVTILGASAAQGGSSSSSSSSSSTTRDKDTRKEHHNSSSHRDHDQDDARDALRKGKVMPLTAILEIAFRRERGMVLEVELETEGGVLTYKIDLLSDAGRKVRMRLNARTGEILDLDYR